MEKITKKIKRMIAGVICTIIVLILFVFVDHRNSTKDTTQLIKNE